MDFEKSIPFKNWANEDFTGRFDATDYTFLAGATYNVPSSMASHFAKQLAVRELHKLGTPRGEMLSDQDMAEYMGKCFPGTKPAEAANAVGTFDRLDAKEDEAKEAVGVKDQNVVAPEEVDEDEETVDDEKNNAGAPKFKAPAKPRASKSKSKDSEYVKA